MSLRATLERRKSSSKAPLSLPVSTPDRIIVSDPFLIDHCEAYLEEDDQGNHFMPLNAVWRVAPVLDSYDWEDDKPAWLDQAVEDSKWSYENTWDGGSVAWTFDSRLIIQAPFALTLSDKVSKSLKSERTLWSDALRGWVIVGADPSDGILQYILETYGIMSSTRLQDLTQGIGRWRETLDAHIKRAQVEGFQIPSMFPTERTLKEHQQEAVLALSSLRQGLLADQVGLGKSGEFISSFLSIVQYDVEHNDADIHDLFPCVLITTASLKEEAVEEILKWKADARVELLYGTTPYEIDPRAEFIVLNIDILNAWVDAIIEAEPKAVVLDEAHMAKNPDAVRSQAMQKLSDHLRETIDNPYIVLATGTPFSNMPIELWSLLCILGVEEFFADYAKRKLGTSKMQIRTKSGWRWVEASPRRLFEAYFCDGHYNDYKQWDASGISNHAELNKLLLEQIMVRRRKTDVMHPMPKLDDSDIILMDLDDEARERYDEKADEFADWFKQHTRETAEELGVSVAEALRSAKRKLYNAEAVMRQTALRQEIGFGKIDPIKRWIHRFMEGDPDITGGDPTRNKLIVFAHHIPVQEALMNDPDLLQYGMVYIKAGESPQEAKRLFQTDPRCRLIICYSGAREGHTLTAAKDLLIAELPYVPSWIVQMAGRCWARLSEEFEPHEAYIHYAVGRGTIDARTLNRVRLKKAMFSAVIDGEGMEELADTDLSEEASELMVEMMARGHRKVGIAA